jgi:CheY-like chemotaxis protein
MNAVKSALLVDDNPESLEALQVLLENLGVERIETTTSAERALEILARRSFSLILSDYRMEGMDGVAFCEALRDRGDQTPLVLLSGAPDKAGVIKAINRPKVDFFGKPFKIAELTVAVERLMAA